MTKKVYKSYPTAVASSKKLFGVYDQCSKDRSNKLMADTDELQ